VFLKSLAGLGLVTAACADAGVPRRTVYDWRDLDEAFRAAWDDAIDQATELLEREARRRAYTGVLKPVFQGGRKVGEVREYSDVLLIFTLKALRPEKYRDRSHVTHQGMSLEELVAGSREGAPVWDPPSAPAAAASPFHHNREGTA
jgi:AcrR family transcriptional regulator